MALIPCLDFWFRDVDGYVLLCLKAKRYQGLYRKLDPSNPPKISLLQKEPNLRDVFFSACTFKSEKRAASNVLHVPGLWVDMDFKDYFDGELEAAARLFMFPIQPSFVVLTGNGMHVYWKFDEPQEPSDCIHNLLHIVTAGLKADSCADYARLLRVPGTLNCKPVRDESGQEVPSEKPVKCALTSFKTYSIADFENNEQLNRLTPVISQGASVCFANLDNPAEIDGQAYGRFQELLQEDPKLHAVWSGERPEFESRSEYDMSMASRLCWLGFSNEEIYAILLRMPSGRGKEGRGDYFQRTIGKARITILKQISSTAEEGTAPKQ